MAETREEKLEAHHQVADEVSRRRRRALWQYSLRLLMQSGAFSEEDLQRMMRGQVIETFTTLPCDAMIDLTDDRGFVPLKRALRYIPQGVLGKPLALLPMPRNRLLCPLWERARSGEESIPCCKALNAYEEEWRRLPGPATLSNAVVQVELMPCRMIKNFLDDREVLSEIIGVPEDLLASGPARPQDLLDQAPAYIKPPVTIIEWIRPRLQFLLYSRRLSGQDMHEMVSRAALVTDEQWLPCRDDDLRVHFDPGGYGQPFEQSRCPLQVRALLGDRTVPCAQALSDRPHPDVVDKAKQECSHLKLPVLEELPRSWDSEADQPGGPEDPVRRHRLLPCELLGRLAAETLYPIMKRTAQETQEDPDFDPADLMVEDDDEDDEEEWTDG